MKQPAELFQARSSSNIPIRPVSLLWEKSFALAEQASQLEEVIGYTFVSKDLLFSALTHRSALVGDEVALKTQGVWNERLEFLGDAVLDLVIAHYLLERFPQLPEGDLSRMRAYLVNECALAKVGRGLRLQEFMMVGKGIARQELYPDAVIADAVEALLGAIYLDGGFEVSGQRCLEIFSHLLEGPLEEQFTAFDYKSRLQETYQHSCKLTPEYRHLDATGVQAERVFKVGVFAGETFLAAGHGLSKKRASQEAARLALAKLEEKEQEL